VAAPPGSEVAASNGEELRLAEGEVIIVPVRNMVLFPGVVLPLMIGRDRSVRAIQEAIRLQVPVGIVLQRDEAVDDPERADLYDVGTVAEVARYLKAQDGQHHAVCQGQARFRLVSLDESGPVLSGKIERVEPEDPEDGDAEARFLALKQQAAEVLRLSPGAPEELAGALQAITSAGMLADMVAAFMDIPGSEKQEVLETFDVSERLEKIGQKLGHLQSVLELSNKIRQETQGSMSKAQREYYLREQLRAIQKELGEGGEDGRELEALRESLEAAGMPDETRAQVFKEFARLQRLPESAAEHSMVRTYLEVISELPWSKRTSDELDLEQARAILDADHYGLERVKSQILEYLAVYKLNPEGRRPNLCLVGPPGVGKTSLGQSIARAMGKEFVRVSLGGVHDESEIRGHRRTYIGALPGTIIESMRKAGSRNPVFMLDEMDKLGHGVHGDPSAALLEVLDPEQNSSFRDHYLGVPFDLSKVLFLGTANVLHGIPQALRDRFEVIELPGYTDDEKLQIARRYLVKRQVEAAGLKPRQCRIEVGALRSIIKRYTREAGVRSLERKIGKVCRAVAVQVASGQLKRRTVKVSELEEILGVPRFENEVAQRTSIAGVATGLAWTPFGGRILFVEATSMPGSGSMILTGQLGDVMRESAIAATTIVKSRTKELGIQAEYFYEHDLHMHLPAGGIPKDGPSAGVAMVLALVSLATGRKIRNDVAMTGEISLRGQVLAVGGIKEKVLGAHAAGIKTVLLPARNEPDLADVPEGAREALEFVLLETVDDAIAVAFEKPRKKKRMAGKKAKAGTRKRGKSGPRR
jgi:ATP-dependent Lon protease